MSDEDVLDRASPPPDLVLTYGPLPEHVVDVRLPAAPAPAPLVVVVHGGFWRSDLAPARSLPASCD